MRKFAVLVLCALSAVSIHAGDVATFVNIGFSPDGARYSFGQYGVTDSDYAAYADIFCVDVAKNGFLPGGKFQSKPSADSRESAAAFAALKDQAADFVKKTGIDGTLQGRALYVLAENGASPKTVTFRDFETGSSYDITLNSLAEGAGEKVKSSFYIIAAITGSDGKTVRKTVGLPGFMRDGVKGYSLRRIIADDSGKSLIFVVEKEVWQKKGSSVRFMVETLRL